MLSPDYLARVMEGAEEVASQLHTDILNDVIRRIMIRLDRGDKYVLTATDKWQIETLMEAGYLREEIVADIAKRTNLQKSVIRKAFEDAGVRSMSFDAKVYEAAGLSALPLQQSPALVRILQTMYERTMGEWENITRTTADEAQKLFIRVCDNAYTQVMSGAKARSQAVREAVEAVARDGVTVTYPTGHTDTIEVATARAVRTGITQSAAQITLERMKEMDVDLVLTSSHLGARPTHEPWQGKVFHVDFSVLTGRLRSANTQTNAGATHSEYPDLVEATRYGYVDGLCGANCRHSMVPYIEGVTKNPFEQFDSEENQKRYEIEQKQREMERKIRKVKREVQGLQEALKRADELTKPGLEQQHQKRAQRLTELNKEYKKYCEDNDLKTRQERLSIAGWTRSNAAKATGAARRTSNPIAFTEKDGIITVEVDRLTPCLLDNKTGEILPTTASRILGERELSGFNKRTGWFINWRDKFKEPGTEVYKLTLDKDGSVQGLVALRPQKGCVYIDWGVANPLSQTSRVGAANRQYTGIGGHLFAIAAKRSVEIGGDGWIFGRAANIELLEYYKNSMGAKPTHLHGPGYSFMIEEEAAKELLKEYTFEWGAR